MRAGFYNIRGFGRPGRRTQIKDFISRERLDFVGLQETIKASFTPAELLSLDPHGRFAWKSTPAQGRSGGMLLGVNEDAFEVLEWHGGAFFIRADVLQLDTSSRWSIFVVYGPADHRRSADFLEELSAAVNACPFPLDLAREAAWCQDPIETWHRIAAGLRQFLRGWGANLGKEERDLKADILAQIRDLDGIADRAGLDDDDWALRYHLEGQLLHLSRVEEEKCAISSLVSDSGIITDERELQAHIYDFYRGLMGAQAAPSFLTLSPSIWHSIRRVSEGDNDSLMLTFSGEEMDTVLASMKTDTAPGPDGFPVFFFKEFWQLAKPLILAIANGFALGRVYIARLNMGVLSLIPKVPGANDIRQFRPIALINIIFKFVAKAYAIRLSPIAHRTISLTQSAFIRGHHIHEGILALQEIIHETKSKKLQGVFLKLEFEKAYDRVNWAFLREVLLRKGFEPGWVHRVIGLVSGGQTSITVNGEVGNFFRNGRGYADDTIIMLQPDDLAIANLKYILLCFENMSGLRINFHKSEVMVIGGDETEGTRIANMLNCKRGTFPFTYLGLPVSDRALLASDWGPLTNKVAKRADPWMGKLMSSAARLTLINACLSSLPLHAMAVCLLGAGVHGLFDKARSRFYWEANGAKRKYHWVRWSAMCKPKCLGG
nr:uncharacterized protein LOC127315064 [Lolium perenne]